MADRVRLDPGQLTSAPRTGLGTGAPTENFQAALGDILASTQAEVERKYRGAGGTIPGVAKDVGLAATSYATGPLGLLDSAARLMTEGARGPRKKPLPEGPLEKLDTKVWNEMSPVGKALSFAEPGKFAAVLPAVVSKAAKVGTPQLTKFMKREGVGAEDFADTLGEILSGRLRETSPGVFKEVGEGQKRNIYSQRDLEGLFEREALERADLIPYRPEVLSGPSSSTPMYKMERTNPYDSQRRTESGLPGDVGQTMSVDDAIATSFDALRRDSPGGVAPMDGSAYLRRLAEEAGPGTANSRMYLRAADRFEHLAALMGDYDTLERLGETVGVGAREINPDRVLRALRNDLLDHNAPAWDAESARISIALRVRQISRDAQLSDLDVLNMAVSATEPGSRGESVLLQSAHIVIGYAARGSAR